MIGLLTETQSTWCYMYTSYGATHKKPMYVLARSCFINLVIYRDWHPNTLETGADRRLTSFCCIIHPDVTFRVPFQFKWPVIINRAHIGMGRLEKRPSAPPCLNNTKVQLRLCPVLEIRFTLIPYRFFLYSRKFPWIPLIPNKQGALWWWGTISSIQAREASVECLWISSVACRAAIFVTIRGKESTSHIGRQLNLCKLLQTSTFFFAELRGTIFFVHLLWVEKCFEFAATPRPEAMDQSIKARHRIITFSVNQSAARSVSEASVQAAAPPSRPPTVRRNYSIV